MAIRKIVTKKIFDEANGKFFMLRQHEQAIKKDRRELMNIALDCAKRAGMPSTLNIIGDTPNDWYLFIKKLYENQ